MNHGGLVVWVFFPQSIRNMRNQTVLLLKSLDKLLLSASIPGSSVKITMAWRMCGNTPWVFMYLIWHRIESYPRMTSYQLMFIETLFQLRKVHTKKWACHFNKILSFLITFTVHGSTLQLWFFFFSVEGGSWHTKLWNWSLDGVIKCFVKISLPTVYKLLYLACLIQIYFNLGTAKCECLTT